MIMIKTMFGNCYFFSLDQSDVSFMFFDAELDGPSGQSDVHLATFTGDLIFKYIYIYLNLLFKCNFIFVNMPHHLHKCTITLYDYAIINY